MSWFFWFVLSCSVGLNAGLGLVVLWQRLYLGGVIRIVLTFIRKQNHEKCWWYPELLEALRVYLGIKELPPPCTITKQEFKGGCERFQDEQEFAPDAPECAT